MSGKSQRRRKALASGTGVAIAIFAALMATGLSLSGPLKPSTPDKPETTEAPKKTDWREVARKALDKEKLSFAEVKFKSGVLTLSGDTDDAETRARAFDVVKQAVLGDPSHVGTVLALENAITLGGQAMADAPDAASTMGATPDAKACQTAYDTLLDGRVINFGSGSAVLAEDSKPLLNALAAVAKRCETYRVELGGHTDARGDATANQALSERRAQSVADYLVSKSVPASLLGVSGYGETQPKDAAGNAEADARNRRIEFKIVEDGAQ
ncbi:MAG: hypothetical protein CFE32_12430 [Alphaproteobacteria bacterium PA3]|nr:MAG: hypothetical protein CFE32_12430 [Alphaproteobacteria bacterium PA3]